MNAILSRNVRFALRSAVLAFGAILVVSSPNAFGYPGELVFRLGNAIPLEQLGASLAVSGDTLVMGASGYSGQALASGRVYVYDLQGRRLDYSVDNPTPGQGYVFGSSVAASGDHLYVGSPGNSTRADRAGAVFVYDLATGDPIRTVYSPSPSATADFGGTIVATSDDVWIGAPGLFPGSSVAGAVYEYDIRTGELVQTYRSPNPHAGDQFGFSIRPAGDRVFVGAFASAADGVDAGIAYLFDRARGEVLQTYHNPEPTSNDRFGSAIATYGNQVLISAHRDDYAATDSGIIYMFDVDTAQVVRTFPNPYPDADDKVGYTIAMVGRHLIMCVPDDDLHGQDVGVVHVFDIPTGDYIRRIVSPTRSTGGEFGFKIAAWNNDYVISAWHDSTSAEIAGSVSLVRGTDQATRRIAISDFAEPQLGSSSFVPRPDQSELGFRSRLLGVTGGVNPFYGVAVSTDANSPVLVHQSVNAETTFDFVPLDGLHEVSMSMRLRVVFTGYESGDFVEASITDGQEVVPWFGFIGNNDFDDLDFLSRVAYRYWHVEVPPHWTQVSLIIRSSSNSSAGSEPYEFDEIRIHGVQAVPEPSALALTLCGCAVLIAVRTLSVGSRFRDARRPLEMPTSSENCVSHRGSQKASSSCRRCTNSIYEVAMSRRMERFASPCIRALGEFSNAQRLLACSLFTVVAWTTVAPTATATPLASAGFNDMMGLNADETPDSPYGLGGPLGGSGGGEPGWVAPWTGGNLVQTAVVFEGDGAAQITPTSEVHRAWAPAATNHFEIEQYVRLSAGARLVAYVEQQTPGNALYQGPIWQAFPDGRFYIIDGVGDGAAVAPQEFSGFTWEPDVWYKINIVGDVASQTWEFFVNDERYDAPDPLGYRGIPSVIDRIRFLSEGSGPVYLDAVTIVPEPSSMVVAFITMMCLTACAASRLPLWNRVARDRPRS